MKDVLVLLAMVVMMSSIYPTKKVTRPIKIISCKVIQHKDKVEVVCPKIKNYNNKKPSIEGWLQ